MEAAYSWLDCYTNSDNRLIKAVIDTWIDKEKPLNERRLSERLSLDDIAFLWACDGSGEHPEQEKIDDYLAILKRAASATFDDEGKLIEPPEIRGVEPNAKWLHCSDFNAWLSNQSEHSTDKSLLAFWLSPHVGATHEEPKNTVAISKETGGLSLARAAQLIAESLHGKQVTPGFINTQNDHFWRLKNWLSTRSQLIVKVVNQDCFITAATFGEYLDSQGMLLETVETGPKSVNGVDCSTPSPEPKAEPAASAVEDVSQSSGVNDIALSGLLKEPERKDDWFEVIDDTTKALHQELSKMPNEIQVWGRLSTNPPAGYTVTTGTDRGEISLTMQGFKPLSRSAFTKRWKSYTNSAQ